MSNRSIGEEKELPTPPSLSACSPPWSYKRRFSGVDNTSYA